MVTVVQPSTGLRVALGIGLRAWRTLRRYPVIPALIVIVLVVCAIFAPWLAQHDPRLGNIFDSDRPPTWQATSPVSGKASKPEYILGTDPLGQRHPQPDHLGHALFPGDRRNRAVLRRGRREFARNGGRLFQGRAGRGDHEDRGPHPRRAIHPRCPCFRRRIRRLIRACDLAAGGLQLERISARSERRRSESG